MYDQLYEAWRRELENTELQMLPTEFYRTTAKYVKRLKKESRMLDRRSLRARLLEKEMRNVKRMIRGLVRTRFRKLVERGSRGKRVRFDFLTSEEKKIYKGVQPLAEAYQVFIESTLRGNTSKLDVEQKRKRIVLRFLESVPEIIGSDMKAHGPFKVEDVSSLPVENAKILVNQNLAESVEVLLTGENL